MDLPCLLWGSINSTTGTCGGTEVTSDPFFKSRRCFQRRRSAAYPSGIQTLKLNNLQTAQGQLLNNFVSGSVGGFVGTVLNTPYVSGHFTVLVELLTSMLPLYLDLMSADCQSMNDGSPGSLSVIQVVKSRIQGAERLPGVAPKYSWSYPAYASIP